MHNSKSKRELEERIHSLEESLAELKRKLADLQAEEQHEAIDHLNEFLHEVDHELDSLRTFWPEAMKELRRILGRKA